MTININIINNYSDPEISFSSPSWISPTSTSSIQTLRPHNNEILKRQTWN
jgi:hypothetical protein